MRRAVLAVALLALGAAVPATAQEMEPRAYSASPIHTSFAGVAIGLSSGDVLLDPSLPITNVSADIYSATAGYGRVFGLAGRQGLVSVALPYADAHVEGDVNEASQQVRRSGLADLRFRASWNLIGSPALAPREFIAAPRRTIFGISLTVQAPTGQYDRTRLVNLGTNRWAFKPELGVAVPIGGWSLEASGGAWFFTNNGAYYPGSSTRRQDPLTSLQAHVSYTFKPQSWLAVNATWYGGGATTVDDGPPAERFSNSRVGATFSQPVGGHNSLKFAASRGTSARTGSDFTTYAIAWQIVWFDR